MGRYGNLVKGNDKPEKKAKVAETTTDSPVSSTQPTQTGINIPSYQPTNIPADGSNEIASIHKALRQTSSTAASYRFSTIEKQRLEVALFELKTRSMRTRDAQDIRTNENEVVRISLNYILDDYKAKGDESVLVRALLSLRS